MNIFSKLLSRSTMPTKPQYGGGGYSFSAPVAGVPVDEYSAYKYSAVWRAANVIAQTVAGLPWIIYKEDGERQVDLKSHPLFKVLNRKPNEEMTPFTFIEALLHHAMIWGSGYAEIERDRLGNVVNLWLITPDRVQVDRDSHGKIVYKISNANTGGYVTLGARSIFHLKGPSFDGISPYSLVRLASDSISFGLALQKYGAAFFGNGSHPGGVLEASGKISDPARQNIIKSWEAMHKGPFRAGKTAMLEEGVTFKPIGINPTDAQAIETRDFEITEATRWFGVPPHKLGKLSDATFSNVEQQNTEFAQEAVIPWVTRLEQEADSKLFNEAETGEVLTQMDLRSLLRGDSKTRAEVNKIKAERGVISINEWRRDDGLNDIGPDGDLRLVPMNMTSVENAVKQGDTGKAIVKDEPKS